MAQGHDLRILIYSQDGFGLGHLRRNLNISLEIQKRQPSATILIIADSPVAPFFDLPAKCDFVKIPTIIKVDTGTWRPNGWPVDYKEVLAIRSEIIEHVLEDFNPHVFLVDHMPHGALGELINPLRRLRRLYPGAKVILGLRDILGAADVIRKQWEHEGAYATAEEHYDGIWVYGAEDLFDLPHKYDFPQSLKEKTLYQGYVCRQDSGGEEIDDFLELPGIDENLVLLTGGGGHDASYFMDTFLDAIRFLQGELKLTAMIATGPFMHDTQFKLLVRKATGLPVVVNQVGKDVIYWLRRASLVISMGGYNTVCELLHHRKNAIVIPRPGPSAEQTMRSQIMSERGLFDTLHPGQLSAENLAQMISSKLKCAPPIQEDLIPPLQGASSAASHIIAASLI